MPTVLAGLDRLADDQPRTVVHPLHELGAALHVLGAPGHHAATDWAARVTSELGGALLTETRAWAWTTSAIRSRVFLRLPDGTDRGTAEDDTAVQRLADEPGAGIAAELLRPLTVRGTGRPLTDWAKARAPEEEETITLLVSDPAAGGRRFARFVTESWDAWFAAEWRQVRPRLAASARRLRAVRARSGPTAALTAVGPAFRARSDATAVEIAKVRNRRHDVATRGLVLAPSVFGAPHVYVADVPGQPLLLQYPVTPEPAAPSVRTLRRRLETLANPARLEVARAITGEARTAPEVAALWRMDRTAVTRHLRALAAAGLATTERRGRYVRYAIDETTLRGLGDDLVGLLVR